MKDCHVDFRRNSERDGKSLSKYISALEYTENLLKSPLHVLLPIGTPMLLAYAYSDKKRIVPDDFCCYYQILRALKLP